MTRELILASQSASRRAMLSAAGVPFTAEAPGVDEAAVKASMAGAAPASLASALAERKALAVGLRRPDALVLGSDSLVALADGTLLDKPESRADAQDHLTRMSGGRHRIWSAAVLAEGESVVWRHAEAATLTVRPLSDAFIERYLDAEWPAIGGCVGCFRIEGPGVQLFEAVEGSHFTILGLPLLAVLAELRRRDTLPD